MGEGGLGTTPFQDPRSSRPLRGLLNETKIRMDPSASLLLPHAHSKWLDREEPRP